MEFVLKYPEIAIDWNRMSNYLACLSVKDEAALQTLVSKLLSEDIKHIAFRESDLGNQITAIAIEPSIMTRKICSSFPLALRDCITGLNKHSIL